MTTTCGLPPASLPILLRENELSEECKTLLPSLASESWDWTTSKLYQYQGFWFSPKILHGILSAQNHFEANDSDIIIASQPKSGTTWLKALIYALMNRKKYPMPCLDHPLLSKSPHDLVPFMEIEVYGDLGLPDMSTFASPRVFATHIPYNSLPKSIHASGCKVIYVCRNPKDTFVSLWHFINKVQPENAKSLEEAFDMFQRGFNPWGPYWEHVLSYWRESCKTPPSVFFLKYEDIQKQPRIVLKKISQFLGCPFSQEEELVGMVDGILDLCSFEKSSNLDVNKMGKIGVGMDCKLFFRKGNVGDSANYLSLGMIARLDQITKEKFHDSGLEF